MVKCTTGYWKGGSDRLFNLRSGRSQADFVLVMEQWTSSLHLQGCWGNHGFAHPVYMCFVDLENAYDRVTSGTYGPCITSESELCLYA